MEKTIFVGNLPQTITRLQLTSIFSKYGKIVKINIEQNHNTHAFIVFDKTVSAYNALNRNNYYFGPQKLIVKIPFSNIFNVYLRRNSDLRKKME